MGNPDHYNLKLKTLYGGVLSFNAETATGIQLPKIESIKRFIPKVKVIIRNNEVWKCHSTSLSVALNLLVISLKVMDEKCFNISNLQD